MPVRAHLAVLCLAALAPGLAAQPAGPGGLVDPLIGTANGGNTFPGAVLPFGMLAWSPETTRGDALRRPAPGGYQYDATRVHGFSLTHLSGTGCRGASGDVPFLPFVGEIASSPSLDSTDRVVAPRFSHANETVQAGSYGVRLASGVHAELTATLRTGAGRFTFPPTDQAVMLVRTSDSEVGSSDATTRIDPATRTISGSVTSGNFCGYINEADRRSYYTLYFVAEFDQPFTSAGTWQDATLRPDTLTAQGGTTYGSAGIPRGGRGSGGYVRFDARGGAVVNVRVGISYVSEAGARANLAAEQPAGTTFETVEARSRAAWDRELSAITITGGTDAQRTIFYTALYHSLLHPNLFSDTDGQYRGFDGAVHRVGGRQRAQYANFSGWDIYRSQLQLVTLLRPDVGSDVAQSLYNQAQQNGGVWDRWTHNSGPTYVMAGDPAAISVAAIHAFGGTDFDVNGAYASLVKAATVPTPLDLSNVGCPVECRGQRPSLDQWLSIHYIPTQSNAWGGAGETLEDASADFALAALAERLGDAPRHADFLRRAQYWRNVFNPAATPEGGYVQNRNGDGTWPAFDPASDDGFAEGSSAQYTWMVPFNGRGLLEAMGGLEKATARLDAFFHTPDGGWALTGLGGLHAEMDNEPTIGAPWMYLFAGRPDKAQEIMHHTLTTLWRATPHGIPGNDDLGAMSAWYVWAALGMYPNYPGRAELVLSSPLFPRAVVRRPGGATITISAPTAGTGPPFVQRLIVDGRASQQPWLPATFVQRGGTLTYTLSATPSATWGRRLEDAPPSFDAR